VLIEDAAGKGVVARNLYCMVWSQRPLTGAAIARNATKAASPTTGCCRVESEETGTVAAEAQQGGTFFDEEKMNHSTLGQGNSLNVQYGM